MKRLTLTALLAAICAPLVWLIVKYAYGYFNPRYEMGRTDKKGKTK